MAVVGSLPAQYFGRGPGPLYIEISHHSTEASHLDLIESFLSRTPHHRKNTAREVVFPLYCSSSAQEAIHHTTHRSRVLHHNGGPNLYKPRVSCVVHRASLELWRGCTTKKDTSVTFWAERIFFCHTYDTSMTIIVTKPGIIIDVVGSYFYDKKS